MRRSIGPQTYVQQSILQQCSRLTGLARDMHRVEASSAGGYAAVEWHPPGHRSREEGAAARMVAYNNVLNAMRASTERSEVL